ncbi:TPA: hypothetical protein DEB00_00300 [Candidatus Uhrbacteria bacterium]|nr:hypothetical protein [Candidatus Uhrbacteria bacterium]
MDISLPARVITYLGPIPLTDGQLGAILVSLFTILFFVLSARRFSLVPTRMQLVLEFVHDYIMEQLENAFHSKKRANAFFPLFMTLLIFILVSNQFALMPLVFEIMTSGGDVFRQPTSDLTNTLALSLVIFLICHFMAFKISPLKHLSNFFNVMPLLRARSVGAVFSAGIEFFIGLLNIIGEFAKIVSLAARLFGNVFAGNVMVAVIMSLSFYTQFLAPLPFIVLSTFSGLVQSFVFMLLAIQFVALSIDGATPAQDEQISQESLEVGSSNIAVGA